MGCLGLKARWSRPREQPAQKVFVIDVSVLVICDWSKMEQTWMSLKQFRAKDKLAKMWAAFLVISISARLMTQNYTLHDHLMCLVYVVAPSKTNQPKERSKCPPNNTSLLLNLLLQCNASRKHYCREDLLQGYCIKFVLDYISLR